MADECTKHCRVLILIVMEHALGVTELYLPCFVPISRLNPYCNGTCSRSTVNTFVTVLNSFVLILIVMEHALGAYINLVIAALWLS